MITAHSPKYNAAGTIDLIVKFPWLDVEVPFSASQNDTEQHGRDLYVATLAGEFGPIAPYVAPPIVAQIPKSCTSLQFMDRFTEAEQLAIVSATMSVPAVKLWYDRMIAATEIVYKDPRTLGGLQALSQGGLIAPNRVDEILPPEWR